MKFSALRNFDAYARAEEHLTTQTLSGAIVSVSGFALMLLLFASELAQFWQPLRMHEMTVDATRDEKLQINVNITFPALPCALLSLDALDMSGKHEVDIAGHLHKTMLDASGTKMPPSPSDPSADLRNQRNGAFGGPNANVVRAFPTYMNE
eukprot:7885186-Pyramimonas_sp.AAC.1